MESIKNQDELEAKLQALGNLDEETKKSIVCSLIGHSRIQETCFGYYSCGRCGQQLGDNLGSVYPDAKKVVIIGHNCKTCQENYKKLDWKDKYLTPDPFQKPS